MKIKIVIALAFLPLSFVNAQHFSWAKQMGGNVSGNVCWGVAADAAGNTYSTGAFAGKVNFNPGTGVFNMEDMGNTGGTDVFISKLDASGNFVWAKQIGSPDFESGDAITVDKQGNSYVAGHFNGTVDFDPGAGTFNMTATTGATDAFIVKLDASGNFVWAKQFKGTDLGQIKSLLLDNAGNCYVTGYFRGTVDFDPGTATYNLTASVSNTFICKLTNSGNWIWTKLLGGDDTEASSLAIHSSGVYIGGSFNGTTDFDPSSASHNLTAYGSYDAFVAKLDLSGNFLWAGQLGGTSFDDVTSIALDTSGNVYVTGDFRGTADFDPGSGTLQLTSDGLSADAYLCKLSSSGKLEWAQQMGGPYDDFSRSIGTDAQGEVFTIGQFQGTASFNSSSDTMNLTAFGGYDMFITKTDASGKYSWVKQIGGAAQVDARSVYVDPSGNVYGAGDYQGTADFDPDTAVYNMADTSNYTNIFIFKLCSLTVSGVFSIVESISKIYPNPAANGECTLEFGQNISEPLEMEISDVWGRLVMKTLILQRDFRLNIGNLVKGTYFVKVQGYTTQKLMVR